MTIRLTAQQLRFVEYLADPTDHRTQAEVAEELGVCRETVSRWKRTKPVWELSFSMALLYVGAELGKVLGVVHRSAMKGDIRAARLLLEVSGVIQPHATKKLFVQEAYLEYLDPVEQVEREVEKLTDAQKQVLAEACRRIAGTLTTDWGTAKDHIMVSDAATVVLDALTPSVSDQVSAGELWRVFCTPRQ